MQIDLRVLGHRVRVTTKDEAVGRAIGLFWEPALIAVDGSVEDKKRRLDYVFEAGRLYFRGEIVGRADSDIELLTTFERHLLDTLVTWGKETCLLHGAAVVVGKDLIVLLGPSGAGKSTFARWLVEAGAAYLSDDLLSLADEWLDGAARSIQFDALTDGLVPPYFADHALVDYPTPGFAPGALQVPVYRRSYRGSGPVFISEHRVVLVRLSHGERDELLTLSALERLSCLHAATLVGGKPYVAGLDHGLGFDLSWRDPALALSLLRKGLSG